MFGECKNVGYGVANEILSFGKQMREYLDLAVSKGRRTLHVFTNLQTDTTVLKAISDNAKVPGKFTFHTFEGVLGVKINAWVQGTLAAGLYLSSIVGDR